MHATRVLAFWVLGACYSTPQPDCSFVCGSNGECPENYQCASDGWCHRDGTPSTLVCMVDAPPTVRDAAIDTAFFDAPLDGPVDVTAPTVLTTSPADLATGVARNTTITVDFSEPVQGVDIASFTVSNATGSVTPTSTSVYVFNPDQNLMPNATITVSLSAAITDLAGNALAPTSFTFETSN